MSGLELGLTLLFIVFLLVLSGFFSGSETALTAASRARIMQMERAGSRSATIAARLIETRERLIGALLLGNNLVNILASSLMTSLLIAFLGDAAVLYATILMTALVLIFSEVLPKTWAISRPEVFAVAVAPLVQVAVTVFAPVTGAVQKLVRLILRIFGIRVDEENVLSAREEIRSAVDLQHAEGGLHKADRDALGALLDLVDLAVSDVMVHRTAMQSLNADDPPEAVVEAALASPYTRLPLWREEPENIVGVLHAKDLLRALHAAGGKVAELDIGRIARPPWFVPDTTGLQDQLNAFLKRKVHFALVVDEYGEVMGLVTLEDILEEIVGDIADEHDVEVQGVRPQPDGSILVDGHVTIRDLNRALDWSLPDAAATTAAGLVIHEAQMIPEENQAFTFYGVRFEIVEKDRNRITKLRLSVPEPAAAAD
jgi:Mg2+/Co2+ transporter CorB